MISSFWVSFGLMLGVLAIHVMVPPLATLLRLPALPSNWIVGGVGIALGSARFWLLFIPVAQLSFAGEAGLLPDGWFGLAAFAGIGLGTLAIYMAWIASITAHRPNHRVAAVLAPLYAGVIVAETIYVHSLLPA